MIIKHLYEFREFRIDTGERTLTRRGEPLELTPKAFELLCALIENHGKLVEKDALMARVWGDSCVEESNLTFNIRQLRKTLGDHAREPEFIKTVPRHGYRFIAAVKKVDDPPAEAAEEPLAAAPAEIEQAPAVRSEPGADVRETSRPSLVYLALTGALLIAIISIGTALWSSGGPAATHGIPVMTAPASSQRITATGGVYRAAISPNGKKMAYSSEIGGKQGIWIKEFATSENIQVIPNSEAFYYGLEFSNDGESLYFSKGEGPAQLKHISIYRVSAAGGVPREVVSETEGSFSLSADDKGIAFVRCAYTDKDYCALFTANVDGSNERRILTRERPVTITDSQFSPDGRMIAIAEGHSRSQGREFGISTVDLATGAERNIVPPSFFRIAHLRWLPDQSGLLATVFEEFYRPKQIFHVSAADGKTRPLTADSINYNQISLDRNAERIVATQYEPDFRLWVAPSADPGAARAVSVAFSDFVFAPGGRIVYSSTTDGLLQLWIMNPDGTEQRQLTNGKGANWHPAVSGDERYIYFNSNRSGGGRVWRMNIDGTGQVMVPDDEGGTPIHVSADGSTVYYVGSVSAELRRAALRPGGGAEISTVSPERIYKPAVDHRGERIAYFHRLDDGRYRLGVRPLDGGPAKTFDPVNPESLPSSIFWSADGSAFYYAARVDASASIWMQRLDKEKPEKWADLGIEDISDSAMSPDGKHLAFIRGRWNHDAVLIEGFK